MLGLSDVYIGVVEGMDKWLLDNLPFNNSKYFINVAGHGSDGLHGKGADGIPHFAGEDKNNASFEVNVINKIINSDKYKNNPDMPINLQACNLANTNIPQWIADKTGRKVYAVYGYYYPGIGGPLYGGGKAFYPKNNDCNKGCK